MMSLMFVFFRGSPFSARAPGSLSQAAAHCLNICRVTGSGRKLVASRAECQFIVKNDTNRARDRTAKHRVRVARLLFIIALDILGPSGKGHRYSILVAG